MPIYIDRCRSCLLKFDICIAALVFLFHRYRPLASAFSHNPQIQPLKSSKSSLFLSHMCISGVIFDLDGTLLDTEALSTRAMNQVLRRFGEGFQVDWALKKKILGMRGDEWGRVVVEELQLSEVLSPDELVRDWEINMNATSSEILLLPGAAELISNLHSRNIPMAVATSSSKSSFEKKIARYQSLFDLMSVFVCGDDVEVRLYPSVKPIR